MSVPALHLMLGLDVGALIAAAIRLAFIALRAFLAFCWLLLGSVRRAILRNLLFKPLPGRRLARPRTESEHYLLITLNPQPGGGLAESRPIVRVSAQPRSSTCRCLRHGLRICHTR